MNNDMEAAQEGTNDLYQLLNPIYKIMEAIAEQLDEMDQRLEAYIQSLDNQLLAGDRRANPFIEAVNNLNNQFSEETKYEIETARSNGQAELADQLQKDLNANNSKIERELGDLRAKAWMGEPYKDNIQQISQTMAQSATLHNELARDNQTMDYSQTMAKADRIKDRTAEDRNRSPEQIREQMHRERFGGQTKEQERQREPKARVKDPSYKSIDDRIKEAYKEARQMQAAGKSLTQQLVKDAPELVR